MTPQQQPAFSETEADFPFDPALPEEGIHTAYGLEKLRYIPDRRLARVALEFFQNVTARRRRSR